MLNADEIYQLVAPLWARVPDLGRSLWWHPERRYFVGRDPALMESDGVTIRVPDRSAVADIRTEIEDWLIQHGGFQAYERGADFHVATHDGVYNDFEPIRALVAAAHALADTMGIPRAEGVSQC